MHFSPWYILTGSYRQILLANFKSKRRRDRCVESRYSRWPFVLCPADLWCSVLWCFYIKLKTLSNCTFVVSSVIFVRLSVKWLLLSLLLVLLENLLRKCNQLFFSPSKYYYFTNYSVWSVINYLLTHCTFYYYTYIAILLLCIPWKKWHETYLDQLHEIKTTLFELNPL